MLSPLATDPNESNLIFSMLDSMDTSNSSSTQLPSIADSPIDYVFFSILSVLFVIGAPLNLVAFQNLNEPAAQLSDDSMTILRRHLNFSDLFIIFVYTPTTIWWILNPIWTAGPAFCKGVKFLHSLSFFISSNIIVCIALNRLMLVLCAGRAIRRTSLVVKSMVGGAWALAMLQSLPQLIVYTVWYPDPSTPTCGTIWDQQIHSNGSLASPIWDHLSEYYSIYALVLVFWLPAVICWVCYVIVAIFLCNVAHHAPLTTTSTAESIQLTDNGNHYHHHNNIPNDTSVRNPKYTAMQPTSTVIHKPASTVQNLRRTAAGVSLLLVVTYIICWLPYNLVAIWATVDPKSFRKSVVNEIRWLVALVVLNSVVNPLLYNTVHYRHKRSR